MSSSFFLSIFLLLSASHVFADPATLSFTDCFDSNANVSQKINVSTVYAQALVDDSQHPYLNLTVFASSPLEVEGYSNDSSIPSNLATLFMSTSVLTLSVFSDSRYWCDSLQPPSPLPTISDSTARYCPIPAGDLAFSAKIPWGDGRALTTLTTRLRAVDPFSSELMCVEVETTPLDSDGHGPYGVAFVIFWASVALSIAYWAVVGVARIVSAWGRGTRHSGAGVWSRAQSAGYILASAVSGERLATTPALMRFCTPSMRDIIFHTQWCSALAMIAVQWPSFVYPLLKQTSWAMLTYNISLTDGARARHWNPLQATPYNPPSQFADQLTDVNNPIHIDTSVPNTLFILPSNATSGMDSFAYTVGVNPRDLFPICMVLFLAIMAATVVLSVLIWFIDYSARFIESALGHASGSLPSALRGARSPAFSSKDMLDATTNADESKSLNGNAMMRPPSRLTLTGGNALTTRKAWWKVRTGSSFHGSVLHGNLVRILVLFHLPVTIFSVFQMTMPKDIAPTSSIVLAGVSFAVFSVILPALLVVRVHFTSTNKLYDETRTLLSLGPLYNHYRHGSQMFAGLLFATNVVFGVVIGAGQKSGTAQAIVILVVEVVNALVTSLWLPWGTGASMGLISFLFCVARIVVAVLLVILTPAISIDDGAGGWVAYGILVILGLIFVALLAMLLVKLTEAAVRIFGGVGFDRSRHAVDSGLLGACGMLGCCGGRKRRRRRSKDRKKKGPHYEQAKQRRDSEGSSLPPPQRMNRSSLHSSNTGPPPSVLRPEHALRPYREDSDDEGFIMGAWQPFTKQSSGYVPVNDPGTSSPKQPSSGFSRVGGGKAHIDTPYAITPGASGSGIGIGVGGGSAAGSTHTFPSLSPPTASQTRVNDFGDEISVSSNNAVRQQQQFHAQAASGSSSTGLPPGAMPPFHVRTKSETAIIENAGPVAGGSRPPSRANNLNVPPTAYRHSLAASEDEGTPKKKPWFALRRHRAHSTDGASSSASTPAKDEEEAIDLGGPSSQPAQSTPGRSFVVIRKGQQAPNRPSRSTTPTPTQATFTAM